MKHLLRINVLVMLAVLSQPLSTQGSRLATINVQTESLVNDRVTINGDVNGDGEVNISDINAITDMILGGEANNRGDVNGDGEVNISDINTVIDIILGGDISPKPATKTFTVNGVNFSMVAVSGGTFTMGATSEQSSDASSYEYPTHQVTLSDYYIGQTEVTQELWLSVMGNNPSNFEDLQHPVECVSWDSCQAFIIKLNTLTGKDFRLPTEAEWEFAARGGNLSKGYKYAGGNIIGNVAWFGDNSGNKTHAVAKKKSNELGLYDMSGNVFEWCGDWYGSYQSNIQNDPTGPESGMFRVLRGGCYDSNIDNCRVACRNFSSSTYRDYNLGLRLAFSLGHTAVPDITTQTGDSTVTITAKGDGTVTLYVNNQAVSNPYTVKRGEVDYTISVYATAQEDGMNMSQSETMDITIPALEYTAIPIVITQMNEYAVTITASGEGTVNLYINGQAVSTPYIASRSNSAYTITAYATAKEEGKIMSQSETKNITVPALEYSNVPVITTQTGESAVTLTATGSGTVTLYVNGQAVSNPYTASRSNSAYTITAYATAKEEGKIMSQSETMDITIPALEYTAIPVVITQMNEYAVTITASGEGTVNLYINGQAVSNPYTASRSNSAYTITAYATAKEEGKIMSQSETKNITVPALEYSNVPVITTQTGESAVTLTATGSGTVTLYVNGQAVSNPYTAPRSNSAYTITAYATAKEEGKIMSQSELISITIPALVFEPSLETINVNGVSFIMVYIEGGTFQMGATPEQGDEVWDKEKPVHQVTLSSYSIGQTEVTQELWQAVMGENPSYHTGDSQRPVEQVSWVDCQEFIAQLNQLTGKSFRLPTEAEWEYAARGGNLSQGYRYAGSNDMDVVSWWIGNSDNTTHPVGTKVPNELGLYDMTGNVWEWCSDWYKLYTEDPQVNPTGPETGNNRVLRGGCWNGNANYNRISFRDNFTPTGSNSSGGLRLVK